MEYTARQLEFSALAKALAHPARIAIIEVLIKRDSCVCGEIVDELPLSQATVSQHLKVLKEASILSGEVEGRNVCYCMNKPMLQRIVQQLGSFANVLKDCC